jgi:uncharacterized protein YdeI (YjbR/CyaY-like superfamily)
MITIGFSRASDEARYQLYVNWLKSVNPLYEYVETAKQNGKWSALDEVEELIIPSDLKQLFDKNKTASENRDGFSRSVKRGILEWILNSKRPETRQKRITETVELAKKNIKANL